MVRQQQIDPNSACAPEADVTEMLEQKMTMRDVMTVMREQANKSVKNAVDELSRRNREEMSKNNRAWEQRMIEQGHSMRKQHDNIVREMNARHVEEERKWREDAAIMKEDHDEMVEELNKNHEEEIRNWRENMTMMTQQHRKMIQEMHLHRADEENRWREKIKIMENANEKNIKRMNSKHRQSMREIKALHERQIDQWKAKLQETAKDNDDLTIEVIRLSKRFYDTKMEDDNTITHLMHENRELREENAFLKTRHGRH